MGERQAGKPPAARRAGDVTAPFHHLPAIATMTPAKRPRSGVQVPRPQPRARPSAACDRGRAWLRRPERVAHSPVYAPAAEPMHTHTCCLHGVQDPGFVAVVVELEQQQQRVRRRTAAEETQEGEENEAGQEVKEREAVEEKGQEGQKGEEVQTGQEGRGRGEARAVEQVREGRLRLVFGRRGCATVVHIRLENQDEDRQDQRRQKAGQCRPAPPACARPESPVHV